MQVVLLLALVRGTMHASCFVADFGMWHYMHAGCLVASFGMWNYIHASCLVAGFSMWCYTCKLSCCWL